MAVISKPHLREPALPITRTPDSIKGRRAVLIPAVQIRLELSPAFLGTRLGAIGEREHVLSVCHYTPRPGEVVGWIDGP